MKTIKVYDTITRKMKDVEVNDDIYVYYNRTKWNIEDNNESFYKHEIQFSQYLDELDLSTFADNDVEDKAINDILIEKMLSVLKALPERDIMLIDLLFFECKSENECASIMGTTQQNISKKKCRILCKLNELLKK